MYELKRFLPDLVKANELVRESSHVPEFKDRWHRVGKKVLEQVAKELGYSKGTYDIRCNKAGPAVSGEVTLHTDNIYIQLCASTCMGGGRDIMYRSVKNRKDYTGRHNNFTSVNALCANPEKVIRLFEAVDNEGVLANTEAA